VGSERGLFVAGFPDEVAFMTMTTDVCFAFLRFPCTTAQEKSTHAGGVASRVTKQPLK
jgi:hypothetical protein